MHEFSLAQGLFKQLQELAAAHQADKIIRVKVEIGKLSGVVVDSFSFGFETLAAENALTSEAVLDITEIEPHCSCHACGNTYNWERPEQKVCPRCGSRNYSLAGGEDLILTQVEME